MIHATRIVTSFIIHHRDADGMGGQSLLILKRSNKVRSMKSLWAGVSGIIEGKESPLTRARIEILEETGLTDKHIALVRKADPTRVISPQYLNHEWLVYPFLFKTDTLQIKLNYENSEYRWISSKNLRRYNTVPNLERILSLLLDY